MLRFLSDRLIVAIAPDLCPLIDLVYILNIFLDILVLVLVSTIEQKRLISLTDVVFQDDVAGKFPLSSYLIGNY